MYCRGIDLATIKYSKAAGELICRKICQEASVLTVQKPHEWIKDASLHKNVLFICKTK